MIDHCTQCLFLCFGVVWYWTSLPSILLECATYIYNDVFYETRRIATITHYLWSWIHFTGNGSSLFCTMASGARSKMFVLYLHICFHLVRLQQRNPICHRTHRQKTVYNYKHRDSTKKYGNDTHFSDKLWQRCVVFSIIRWQLSEFHCRRYDCNL